MTPRVKTYRGNRYARTLSATLDAPKAVWMALAYSLVRRCLRLEGHPEASPGLVEWLLREEWKALHAVGIVPQEPPA